MSATVAFDARMLGASGIGTYIYYLLRELAAAETKLRFNLMGDPEKLAQIVKGRQNFRITPADFPIYSVAEQVKIPSLARGADLLHSPHHNVPLLWSGKLLLTFHDALHWDYPEYIPDWRGKIYLWAISRKIRRADWIITPSHFTAGRVAEIFDFPQEKISVIYEGVDPERFFPRDENSVAAALKKYDLTPQTYILYVGNLKMHKNIIRLVEGYRIAKKRGLEFPLVLAGKIAGLRAKVDVEKILSVPGVRYIGEIPHEDLPYLYSGARALALVSLYEGFGLPPLEAMACGCPVLASDAASLPEVVGDAALIVNPYDVDEIAESLQKICLDLKLRKNLIERGGEQARKFRWHNTARQTLEVYRKLMEREI